MNTLSPIVDRCHHSAFNQFTYILNLKHMKHPFLPQITNVEILDYPILAGSGNIGIKADVLGEKKMKTIGLIEENFWRQTPTENKELAVVCIAARTFRLDLLRHFNMDHKKVQTASELMYHHWDSTGRKEEGYRTEMLVNDNRYFPDNEETEIEFDIHDGFAVGEHEGKEYVMFYPTALDVYMSDSMQQKIRDYVGQAVADTGIIPADIALTYGKVKIVQPAPQQQEQMDEIKEKVKAIHQNTSLKSDMLEAILKNEGYIPDINVPSDKIGKAQKGLLLLNKDNHVTDFISYSQKKAKDTVDFSFNPVSVEKVADMKDLFLNWKTHMCTTRISDIHIRQVPNDPKRYFIGCKVDGEQQVSRELSHSDAGIWREMQRDLKNDPDNAKYADYVKNVTQTFAVDYFKDAILNDRTQNQGLKR